MALKSITEARRVFEDKLLFVIQKREERQNKRGFIGSMERGLIRVLMGPDTGETKRQLEFLDMIREIPVTYGLIEFSLKSNIFKNDPWTLALVKDCIIDITGFTKDHIDFLAKEVADEESKGEFDITKDFFVKPSELFCIAEAKTTIIRAIKSGDYGQAFLEDINEKIRSLEVSRNLKQSLELRELLLPPAAS